MKTQRDRLAVRVEFCRLDARDDAFTGYYPVAFSNDDGPVRLGPKNAHARMEMQREYLTRLNTLQNEIMAKYLARFTALENDPLPENDYDGFASQGDYEKVKTEVEKKFPGPAADYYT